MLRMSGIVLLLPLYAFVVADDDNFTFKGRMSSMDLLSVIDSNEEMYCSQKNCKHYFKYLTVFLVTQQNFVSYVYWTVLHCDS